MRTWLRESDVGPAGTRPGSTWREFIRTHRHSVLAVDFFAVETVWLQRLYVLFFIELGTRRVHFAGCTPNPSGPWVAQQARQLTWTLAERPQRLRFLIRDRDSKFTESFDRVFESEGIEIVRTPFRAPQANGVAERFVRTVRSECLDWLLIFNRRHLEQVVRVFIAHYNPHRPHRALTLAPPNPRVCQHVNGETPAFVGAIDLVERFTSTPSPHDGVYAPYRYRVQSTAGSDPSASNDSVAS